MNKTELVDSIATHAGLTKAQAAAAVTAFTDTIGAALHKNDSVTLVGFGTFSVKQRAARTGRNPQTGKEIQIAATKVASFKAGKELKDYANGTDVKAVKAKAKAAPKADTAKTASKAKPAAKAKK